MDSADFPGCPGQNLEASIGKAFQVFQLMLPGVSLPVAILPIDCLDSFDAL